MIALVLIVASFIWLGVETRWLTIRLPYGPSWPHDDLVLEIDSDYDDIYQQSRAEEWAEIVRFETGYKAWLKKRYEPKLIYGASADRTEDYPGTRAALRDEERQLRREGLAIYQRGGSR